MALKDSILLTVSHCQGIQVDNFHFLYVFAVVLPHLVPTPDHHDLSIARGIIGDQATRVIKATVGQVRARGPQFGVLGGNSID